MRSTLSLILALFLFSCSPDEKEPIRIDREEVFNRHRVVLTAADTMNALSLGNGRFAMTMDATGLQTFPRDYRLGMALGTMSEWGWHSFPTDEDYKIEETIRLLPSHGREVPYARQWPSDTQAGQAGNFIRQNPHRVHLANVGWHITLADGSPIKLEDLKDVRQTLDLWKGELISTFSVEGNPVTVTTLVSQNKDVLAVNVSSPLIREGRLGLDIRYPYPTDQFYDYAARYDPDEPSRLTLDETGRGGISIKRVLDDLSYHTTMNSSEELLSTSLEHGFRFMPQIGADSWSFQVAFDKNPGLNEGFSFQEFQQQVHKDYSEFWNTGGMIDLGAIEDPRATELERRMVLSLYLTKINCGGNSPPQETGLTYNSWYGKPHMEMIWWHGVHFALWGRPEVLEAQLDWYFRAEDVARQIAQRQGFEGVRWQKMTDNEGGETVSSVGSYLIWQQPHLIYFAELLYRDKESVGVLEKYAGLVEKTADFMADFAWYDPEKKRYILGPGIIPAQERFDPVETYNPTYELAYWRWGLETAQNWRERQGMPRNEKWDEVLDGLSPLPVMNGLYLATESSPDSYTTERYMTDHPSVLGTLGMLPFTSGVDSTVMRNTFNKIWDDWQWHDTWGWDFPMTAMTAARLGMPEKAVDALLMPITTNTYLANGHNYQTPRLRLYLPGNGGLLTALAMMTAGFDGNNKPTPGMPSNWNVKSEGLRKMP